MTDADTLLGRGLTAHQEGDLSGALALYRQVLALERNNAEAIHLIGVIAYQTGDPATAANVIARAIALDDGIAAYHSNLGEALRALGRLDEAVAAYGRAVELDPGFADAHRNLGVAELARGNAAAAEACFNRVLARDPDSGAALHGLGLALEAQGRNLEAADAFRRCLEREPDHADARARLDALPAPSAPPPAPTPALAGGWAEIVLEDLREQCAKPGGLEQFALIDAFCEALLQADGRAAAPLLERMEERPFCDDIVLDCAVRFRLSRDLAHYQRLIHAIVAAGEQWPLEVALSVYWGIQRQLFLGRSLPTRQPAFVADDLPRFYRWILRQLAERTGVCPRPAQIRAGTPQRVALVTNQFTWPMHQPSRDAFDYARRLRETGGCEVLLINANLLPTAPFCAFVPPFVASMTPELAGTRMIGEEGATVRIWSSMERTLSAEKIGGLVETVEEFDADLVISFGGSVLAADLFAGVRPTLCIPTTSGLTISEADLLLTFEEGDPTAGLPAEYRDCFARRLRPFRFGYTAPPAPAAARRGDFGLPEDGFLFVVVGARLGLEVDRAFVAALDRLLDACPGALVAFAGAEDGLVPLLDGARHGGRMYRLGFVQEIRALYRLAGAYLNPPRQGGGGSAAYALAEGVPVVTTAHGDVAAVAGPEACVPDLDALVARAARLCQDSGVRSVESAAARRRFAAIDVRTESVGRLLDYGRELAGRYAM